MNSRYIFSGILFSLLTTYAVAQDSVYLNLREDSSGNGFISQSADKCSNCAVSMEITDGDVSSGLNTLLKNWKPSKPVTLNLESSLDLGELNAEGSCVRNHIPLALPSNVNEFAGNGNVISNMCYDQTVRSTSTMSVPVGFFGSLQSVKVSNVGFKNISLTVKVAGATAISAANFRSMGTLAGNVKESRISGVSLENVKLTGVMVGGVLGYGENTSINNVTSSDPIVISGASMVSVGSVQGTSYGSNYSAYLGGVAGFIADPSFSDINVNVVMQSQDVDGVAAIGGVVGYFLHNQATDPLIIKNVKVGSETARAVIGGGAHMGGLIGYIKKTTATADINIEESSFVGDLSDPNTNGDVYVGGLVGFNAMSNIAFKISKCTSDISLKSSFASGKNHHFGGVVGGMYDINTGTGKSELISITQSSVMGSINVASGAESSQAFEKISAGGLVGYGGFAVDASPIFEDTVKVDISVALNGSSKADSVYVGGFVGKAGIHQNMNAGLKVKKSIFEGKLKIDGDAVAAYVAGGIGRFYTGESGNFIDFEKVRISGSPLITLAGAASGAKNSGYAAGLCGFCRTPRIVDNIEVKGDFDISRSIAGAGDSLFVGGILGGVTTGANGSNNLEFNLTNTYHVGKISVSEVSQGGVKLGYLIGAIRMRVNGVPYTIKSNYHFGDDYVIVNDAIGFFDTGNSSKWYEFENKCSSSYPCWDIWYNYRNGSKYDVSNYENGTINDVQMKDPSNLLQSLNAAWNLQDGNGTKTWGYEKGKNDDLPYLLELLPVEKPVVDPESPNGGADSASSSSGAVIPESSSSGGVNLGNSSSSNGIVVSFSSSSDDVQVSSSSVKKKAEWRMASIKGLENAGVVPSTTSPIYWWDESNSIGEFWQYQVYGTGDEIEESRGAWVYTADEVTVEEVGPIPEGLKVEWNVDSVYSGWNMVANPYAWTIDVSQIDGIDPERIFRYDGSGYDYARSLKPFEAAWVWTDSHKPLKFTAKAPRMAAQKAEAKSADGWSLRAILTDKYGKQDSRNVMGTNSYVVENPEPPSAMGDHVSLAIIEGKRALAKSLKPETEKMEWAIRLGATTVGDVYLQLNGVDQVNRNGKHVYVTIDGNTTEMKEGSSLKVALKKGSVTAKVTVTAESMELLKNPLGKLHVARTGNGLDVRFDVAAVLAGKNMKVDLVSISGKVEAAMQATTAAGSNAFELVVPKRGVYMLRVRVGSQTAAQRINVQ